MRIDQATAFLYSLKPRGIRFGLENTRLVLGKLGLERPGFQVIHIAGSNGKGSTAAFLDAVLRRGGFRVGLYTSPHLNHYRERFRVDGREVDDPEIGRAMDRFLARGLEIDPAEVVDWIEREQMVERMAAGSWYRERGGASRFCPLTFFECTTILSVLLFQARGVDLAVMECGMGGRLDATNVLSPVVSVITPIHLEHTAWLGDTLEAIAGEKAGIIKPGVPVVCARQAEEARRVFEKACRDVGAPLRIRDRDFHGEGSWGAARFRVGDRRFGPVSLGLAGAHQVENAATAIGCLPVLEEAGRALSDRAVLEGLCAVSWPARFERFGPQGRWILDGAHNPDGIRALAEVVGQVVGDTRVRLVFGVLEDKQVEDMLALLNPLAATVDLVRPADARGRDPAGLRSLLSGPVEVHQSVGRALEKLDGAGGPPVLITGSLTIVGEARAWLLERGFQPVG